MNNFDPLKRIQELCEERGWSCYQLAKASGIAYSTLSTMLNKQNMPTLPTLLKLCEGFGISVTDFFEPDRSLTGLTPEQSECLTLFTSLQQISENVHLHTCRGSQTATAVRFFENLLSGDNIAKGN